MPKKEKRKTNNPMPGAPFCPDTEIAEPLEPGKGDKRDDTKYPQVNE